jgi:hypothetical protein
MSKTLQIECPKHGGSFDCPVFCNLCGGEQEVSLQIPEEVQPEPSRPVLSLRIESVYQILDHLSRDFGLTRNLKDNQTEALRDLQAELLGIALRR